MIIDMQTKKKQCETHIYQLSEDRAEMQLDAVMDMLEAAAKGVNTMVRYAVSSVLKGMDNDQKAALPLTHTVRFRLESDWDRQYLQIGMLRSWSPVPDVGLIRLGQRDSFYLYTHLRQFCNQWQDAARMADLAGKEVEMPDLVVRFVRQPGEKMWREAPKRNVYHPMDVGKMTFRQF